MKYYLIIATFLLSYTCVNAQSVTSPYMGDHYKNALIQAGQGQYQQMGTFKVAGNAVFMEKPLSGEVHFKDASIMNFGKFAYHLYKQYVMTASNDGTLSGELKQDIDWFNLNMDDGRILKFIRNDSLGIKKKGFVMELVLGKNVSLYRYSFCSLVENPNFISAEYRVYDANTEYYLSVGGGEVKKTNMTYKALMKALGNSDKLDKYITDQNLSFGKEVDIIKLVSYANTL